jgi:hypothetical protein
MVSRLPPWAHFFHLPLASLSLSPPSPQSAPSTHKVSWALGTWNKASRPSRQAMAHGPNDPMPGIIAAHAGPGTLAAATTGLQPPRTPARPSQKDPPFFVNPGLYDLFGAGTVSASVGMAWTWLPSKGDPKSLGVPVQKECLLLLLLLLLVSSFCGKLKASSATNNPQPSNRHDLCDGLLTSL